MRFECCSTTTTTTTGGFQSKGGLLVYLAPNRANISIRWVKVCCSDGAKWSHWDQAYRVHQL